MTDVPTQDLARQDVPTQEVRAQDVRAQHAGTGDPRPRRYLEFLASVGPRLLATSLDSRGVLEMVADLVVPGLADYCAVREVRADGSVDRVAIRHADPSKAGLIRRLEAYPPWTQGLVGDAIMAGRPYLAADITERTLASLATDPEHLALLHELGPRSLVAVPVPAQGRILGAVIAVSAASGRRYDAADVMLFGDLAWRAGLAIENALLYEEERAARSQSEQARREIAFLLEASTVLTSTLDFGTGLQRLARLAAGTLCDLCLIDLLHPEDGSIERVAAAAADPAQQPLADCLRERFPPDPLGGHPAARVMRTGEAEFSDVMGKEFLQRTTRSDEHQEVTKALRFRSYISVPLAARGRVLGALTLVATARSGRRYGPEDVALAADLARRAALVLDNARLYQETELQKLLLTSQSEAGIEGVLVVSPDQRIVSHNRQFAQMWMVPDSILTSSDADAVLEWVSGLVVGPEEFRARVNELRDGWGAAAREEIRLRDGRVFDRWTCPLTGSDGTDYGRAWYFRDVTDLKQAQEERSRLYDAERAARLEAETSRARLQFLLEASTTLAGSLDAETALADLAGMIVRAFADRCLIDVVGADASITRIAAAASGLAQVAIEPRPGSGGSGDPLNAHDGAPARVRASRVPVLVPTGGVTAGEMTAAGVASYLGVPLVARGRVLGCLSLVAEAGSARRFGSEDVVLALDLARRASLALDHARLFRSQRHIAMTLQQSLLPPELPAIAGLELAARYRPAIEASEVGGDFYDVFPAGGDAWAFAMGDVSGKGIEAASLTSLARYSVRAAAREHRQPREILSLLNEAVLAERPDGRFFTVVFGRLRRRLNGLRLTVACGGHPLPLLLRASGAVESAARPGTLIGFLPSPHLPEKVSDLGPGDAVVFYTDGLTDVRGPTGTFGEDRLIALLRECRGLSAEAIAARLEAEVLAFLEGEPRDDLAVLVLRVAGESSTLG